MNNDKIIRLKYSNLRENFNSLKNEVLGTEYYNMAMDVYECDRQIVKDMKRKFKYMKSDIKVLKIISVVSVIINILLIGGIIWHMI